jgi:hypothetical protein
VWKVDEQFADAEVGVVEVDIVSAAEHVEGIAAEVAVVVFVIEGPGRYLGPRGLLAHVLEVLVADRLLGRPEADALKFAHTLIPEVAPELRAGGRPRCSCPAR